MTNFNKKKVTKMPGRIAVAACVLITLLGPSMAQSGGAADTAIRDALKLGGFELTNAASKIGPLNCGPNFPSFRNVWRLETFPG
jgi:hypothetical protein